MKVALIVLGLAACGGSSQSRSPSGPVPEPLPAGPEPENAVEIDENELRNMRRVSGTIAIVPDDMDKLAHADQGGGTRAGKFRLCCGADGRAATAFVVESTGLPNYDRKILGRLSEWAYTPYLVDGAAAPFCTLVTFVYTQKKAR